MAIEPKSPRKRAVKKIAAVKSARKQSVAPQSSPFSDTNVSEESPTAAKSVAKRAKMEVVSAPQLEKVVAKKVAKATAQIGRAHV